MTTYTQAEYNALRSAVASGVLRVSYQDRTIQYHSLSEMRALLRDMERVLGINTEDRFTVATFSRD